MEKAKKPKELKNHPWLEMEREIEEKAEIAKQKWGFPHLRTASRLVYDIGEEVYYAINGDVLKGRIARTNPSGMCMVTVDDGGLIAINMQKLYKNVRYALVEADYQRQKNRRSEQNDTTERKRAPGGG